MIWALSAKCVSVIFVLMQIRVVNLWLPAEEGGGLFRLLALVAAVSQAAGAIPILIFSQSAFLERAQKRAQFHKGLCIFAITVILLGMMLFVVSWMLRWEVDLGAIGLICLVAFTSTIPTIFVVAHFARGDLKNGALIGALNVALPQLFAAAGAYYLSTAFGFLYGLSVGHVILCLVVFTVSRASILRDLNSTGSRSELNINWKIVLSTITALFYGWAVPNSPKLLLDQGIFSINIVHIFLLSTLSFSSANAIETLCAQVRRHHWLKVLESKNNQEVKFIFFKREILSISIVYLISWVSSCVIARFVFHIISGSELELSNFFIILIFSVDYIRAMTNTIYSIAESARVQIKIARSLFIAAIVYFSIFAAAYLIGLNLAYITALVALCIGFIISLFIFFKLQK